MLNTKIRVIIMFFCALIIQPMISPGSYALAKRKTPMRAYSFIAEAGKTSQGECDGEKKIPRLKRLKDYSKHGSYMGSELQSPVLKGKLEGEMWKHYFRAKPPCNSVLAKTPSAIQDSLINAKPELPPEDEDDADDDAPKTEVAEPVETQ